jgi:hypothetical protein
MWCCRALTLPRAAGRALVSQAARPAGAATRHATTPSGAAHCYHCIATHAHPAAAARSAKHRPVRWSAAPPSSSLRAHGAPVHTSSTLRRLWATSHRRVTGEPSAVNKWQRSHDRNKMGGVRGYHSRWAVSVYGKEPGLPDEVGPVNMLLITS